MGTRWPLTFPFERGLESHEPDAMDGAWRTSAPPHPTRWWSCLVRREYLGMNKQGRDDGGSATTYVKFGK
jgi:hypothetical protein